MNKTERDIPLGTLFLIVSLCWVVAAAYHIGILYEPAKMLLMVVAVNFYNVFFNKGIKKIFPLPKE